MKSIGQTFLEKDWLFIPHGWIPTFNQSGLLPTVHIGISPTPIRANDTQQSQLIAGELKGHCCVQLIRRPERTTRRCGVFDRSPFSSERERGRVGDLLWI